MTEDNSPQRHLLSDTGREAIVRGDAWLDGETGRRYKEQPLAQDWARAFKVIEETGEAMSKFIVMTGQNPRKAAVGSSVEFLSEMADSSVACMLGIQHFTKDIDWTVHYLAEALFKVARRAADGGY